VAEAGGVTLSQNHHTTTITRNEAAAQLQMMLCNTTDERLAGFTADRLAAMYRVKPATIDEMLMAERERRAERARRDV
jgi:hypothetical protein